MRKTRDGKIAIALLAVGMAMTSTALAATVERHQSQKGQSAEAVFSQYLEDGCTASTIYASFINDGSPSSYASVNAYVVNFCTNQYTSASGTTSDQAACQFSVLGSTAVMKGAIPAWKCIQDATGQSCGPGTIAVNLNWKSSGSVTRTATHSRDVGGLGAGMTITNSIGLSASATASGTMALDGTPLNLFNLNYATISTNSSGNTTIIHP